MKYGKLFSLYALAVLVFFGSACDMADLREDPNNPTNVPESLQLTGLLSNFSYEVVGNQPTRVPNTWIQQLAFNGVPPSEDNYDVDESDVNNLWEFFSWTDVMANARKLAQQGEANENYAYAGIGKVILAWNLGILTDLYGDIPWSEAFDPQNKFKPKYDRQEDIYKEIFRLLDEAIADFDKTSKTKPGTDDLLYGGNMARWKKLAYTLKARFLMHLTKAPGVNERDQAQKALDAVRNGFTGNADDADFRYFDKAGSENPWYQFSIDAKWDNRNQASQYYVDLLKTNRDPRLPVQFRQAGAVGANGIVTAFTPVAFDPAKHFSQTDNTYRGHVNGTNGIGETAISSIGSLFSAADARLNWISYAEAKFIEAEATLITQGAAAAQPIYDQAIQASMVKHGIPADQAAAYVAARPRLTDAGVNALREVMLEKYVANFLNLENYNDWRRNGYPELTPVATQARANRIPLRFPYPSSELTRNSENADATGVPRGFGAFNVPVWWDAQ